MLHREFCEKQHQVTILVPGASNRVLPMNEINSGSTYGMYLRIPYIEKAPFRGFLAFCICLPFTLYQLRRFLILKHINIVTIQYPFPEFFYFALLRRLSSWKLVVTYQGNDVHDMPLWSWIDRQLVRFLLSTSDGITAVSKSLMSKLQLIFQNLLFKKSRVVPNGAPLDLISQNNSSGLKLIIPQEYMLTVGHLIYRKGIDVLIKALKIVRDQGHVTYLVVVGDGPEYQTFMNIATDSGLSESVHFVGNRSHMEVLELFKNCLFFVLASRAEGMPLVILEAMACGKAVVATNVDGIPEIVQHGRTGLLVPPENAQSLAEALITVYKNPKLREELGSHGKELASQEYSWQAIAEQYLNFYSELER